MLVFAIAGVSVQFPRALRIVSQPQDVPQKIFCSVYCEPSRQNVVRRLRVTPDASRILRNIAFIILPLASTCVCPRQHASCKIHTFFSGSSRGESFHDSTSDRCWADTGGEHRGQATDPGGRN